MEIVKKVHRQREKTDRTDKDKDDTYLQEDSRVRSGSEVQEREESPYVLRLIDERSAGQAPPVTRRQRQARLTYKQQDTRKDVFRPRQQEGGGAGAGGWVGPVYVLASLASEAKNCS